MKGWKVANAGQKAATVDPEAHNIYQREFGISNTQKIGTDNLHECVALIMHNKQNNKTMLAHIDKNTNPQELLRQIKGFKETIQSDNVYVLGGNTRKEWHRNPAMQTNIENTVNVLNSVFSGVNKFTKIHVAENILKQIDGIKTGPKWDQSLQMRFEAKPIDTLKESEIIFDPIKHEISRGVVPGKKDRNFPERAAHFALSEYKNYSSQNEVYTYPLNKALDLTAKSLRDRVPTPDLSKKQREELKSGYNDLLKNSKFADSYATVKNAIDSIKPKPWKVPSYQMPTESSVARNNNLKIEDRQQIPQVIIRQENNPFHGPYNKSTESSRAKLGNKLRSSSMKPFK